MYCPETLTIDYHKFIGKDKTGLLMIMLVQTISYFMRLGSVECS